MRNVLEMEARMNNKELFLLNITRGLKYDMSDPQPISYLKVTDLQISFIQVP